MKKTRKPDPGQSSLAICETGHTLPAGSVVCPVCQTLGHLISTCHTIMGHRSCERTSVPCIFDTQTTCVLMCWTLGTPKMLKSFQKTILLMCLSMPINAFGYVFDVVSFS
jgi:hypothetical protein